MQNITMSLLPSQAEALAGQLIGRLTPAAKMRLTKRLESETRRARWNPVTAKLRRRFAQHPLSPAQIRRLCEQVRRERADRAGCR